MQYLLDFVLDHTLEDQLYFVVQTATGEIELLWQRRSDPNSWQLRPYKSEGAWESVARGELLDALSARQTDMDRVERELRALALTQVAFADMVLRDANAVLGQSVVRAAVMQHQDFLSELQTTVSQLIIRPAQAKPKMQVVSGGGAQSEVRSGHLRVIS
jgi:hypothetical protein